MIVRDMKIIRYEFFAQLRVMQGICDSFSSNKIDEKHYDNFFNDVINVVNNGLNDVCGGETSYINLNMDFLYSNVICDNPNEDITWEYLQTTDNDYHKFIFANKVLERCFIILKQMEDLDLLLDLSFYLGLITNVENEFFQSEREEMIYKSFNSRYKSFRTIFNDEVIDLAMDFLKFNNIVNFSEASYIDKDSGSRIKPEQGFEFVEMGKLILNFKLKKALDKLIEVGHNINGVTWPE